MSPSLNKVAYFTLPYLTLPYLTLPYLTLPYLTLPYLTLPYLIYLKIVNHVYISLRTGVASSGKKMSTNQKAHTIFFTCENIICSEIRILFQPNTTR